jgi:hypothetical protein
MTSLSSDSQKSEDNVFTSGVDAIVERMRTHPDEFFEYSHGNELKSRWRFMFKDYFRDAMTETEKGRLHEALKQIRRMEFDTLVVKELMRDELIAQVDGAKQELFDHQRHVTAQIQNQAYNQAQGKYGNAIGTIGNFIGTTRTKP